MRTLQTIQVYAKLNQGLWVGLASVRKNRGHDDSLPYQGTIYNLNDVLDIMAEGFLEIRKKHPHAAQVHYYLDDEKTNPTGTSKYSFPH